MIKIRAFFDGATEPKNPGGNMGIGAVIFESEQIIHEYSHFVPAAKENTNNVAEYLGFTEIVEYLIEMLINDRYQSFRVRIDIRGDSKMVIEQMNGRWKIKSGYYASCAREAKKRWEGLQLICKDHEIPLTLQWVPRELNDKADELSKKKMIENKVEFRIQPLSREN